MSVTTILYKDIAPGADEDAAIAAEGETDFSVLADLPFGTSPAQSISLERNHWGLNGAFQYVADQTIAFWSTSLSGDDCTFTDPPVIDITFDEQYSSVGITLQFDTASGDYCTAVNIKWYQDESLKEDVDFTPDSAAYFCEKQVTSYDRIVITLNKTSLPAKRAKLEWIVFGLYRHFGMQDLRSASIVNEMSLPALELPISKMNWTLDTDADVAFMFQLKQPVEARNNDTLLGVYYVDEYSRTSKNIYKIECYDAFGVLDEIPFPGGVYTNKSAKELLTEILGGDFSVVYDDDVEDTNLTGVLQSVSRREAAQQLFFAWGVCASTDGRETIRIFHPPETPKEIGRNMTYTGVSVSTSAIVTQVQVTAHTYTQSENGGIEINGVKYDDAKTVYTVSNPDVTATDKQNIVEVTDATLVSPAIGQAVAQRVYDYYTKRDTNKAKIVWAGERLGDCVTLPNAWGGSNTGNLAKMEIRLSNTVAASVEAIG